MAERQLGNDAASISIVVVGYGSPTGTVAPRDEQGARAVLQAFRQVFSVLYPQSERPSLILVGPEGVVEVLVEPEGRARTLMESVVKGRSSMVAVQSLVRVARIEDKQALNVYCLELTPNTPALLPWRTGFPSVRLLSAVSAVANSLTPITDSSAPPDESAMGEHWNTVMKKRLAHEESKEGNL